MTARLPMKMIIDILIGIVSGVFFYKKVMNMLKDLIFIVLLLISYMFIGASFYRENPIMKQSHVKQRFLFGLFSGLFALLMMILSYPLNDSSVYVDLRHLSLVVVYYFGGLLPTIMTAIVIMSYRLIIGGFNLYSYSAVLVLFLLIISFIIINRLKMKEKTKLITMFIVSLIIVEISLFAALYNQSNTVIILIIFACVSIGASIILYYLIEYVSYSNYLFRRYKEESTTDYLTGLTNMRKFELILNGIIQQSKQEDIKTSLLMIDIDYFKLVNDHYGHLEGDDILRQLSQLLQSSCRPSDLLSRLGGEEFAIVLLDTNIEEAIDIAEQIRKRVEEKMFEVGDNKLINLTISIGVSSYPETCTDINKLLYQADQGLYMAKDNGRNQIRIYKCNK